MLPVTKVKDFRPHSGHLSFEAGTVDLAITVVFRINAERVRQSSSDHEAL